MRGYSKFLFGNQLLKTWTTHHDKCDRWTLNRVCPFLVLLKESNSCGLCVHRNMSSTVKA